MVESKKSDHPAWWLVLAALGGAIGGALITGAFNHFDHNRDVDAKMIELSVGILRAAPTPETTPLREWAIDVIDKRANFPFNAAQRAVLLKKELPYKSDWILKNDSNTVRSPDVVPCPGFPEETLWNCPAGSKCGPGGSCVTTK